MSLKVEMTTVDQDYPGKCRANLFSIFKLLWMFSIMSPRENLKVRINNCFCCLVSQKVWSWTWSYSDLYHNYLDSGIKALSSIQMQRQKGGECGVGEKPNPNLITLNFFNATLQMLWQNCIIPRQLQLGMFWSHFKITCFFWDAGPVHVHVCTSWCSVFGTWPCRWSLIMVYPQKTSVWPQTGLDLEICVIRTVEVVST